jgi:phosphoesterase RecJ-like protein
MQVTAFAGEFEPAYIVAVDVAGLQLFGPGTIDWAQKSNLCIDHHASHSHYADGLVLDGTAAACAEIVYKLLLEMDVEITPLIADCLYTGIATDTGCFKFANVTPDTHKIAAELMERGAHHTKLNAKLFESKSRSQLAVERQLLKNMEFYYEGRCALTWLTLDDIAATGAQPVDLESTTGIARAIEGVMVGITMRQQPSGSWKISVRAAEEMNASAIATAFGGGGHRGAAGCEVFGGLENAKQALLSEVARHLPTEDEQGGEYD